MELRHLRYFVAVAEEMNVGRAARRLHISQPPLTRQIRQLEQELGVELFERRRQRLHLAVAGEVFLERARRILEDVDHARRAAERAAQGHTGRLRIAFIESATASGLLGAALVRYRRSHPDVDLELTELPSLSQVDALRSGRIDLGCIYTRPPDSRGLSFQMAAPGHVVAAVARSNPLSRQRQIALKRLAREPLIIWRREFSPAIYDRIMNKCRSAGFEPKVAQHTIQMQTTCSLAAAGVGVGIVPSSFATIRRPGVVFRKVRGLGIPVDVELVWRETDSAPALRAFLEVLRELR